MKQGQHRWKVSFQRQIEYEIIECPHLFDPRNSALLYPGKKERSHRFIVLDKNIEKHYGTEIRRYFQAHQVETKTFVLPAGEKNKSVESYFSILKQLDCFPINRRDEPIIAIGGGVVLDVAGFAAGCYRRGLPHLSIPTTLIGYIDASIGIKTGINFNGHKNRLGAFEPPQKVFLDKTFLRTLPDRHILNGVSEILKIAIIKDLPLFEAIESHGPECVKTRFQNDVSAWILDRSIEGMIEELQPNLFEENLARKVDFGHTFCYGLETSGRAELLHGEAVLLDMLLSTLLALRRNLMSKTDFSRIIDLVSRLGILLNVELLDPKILWDSIVERTYHRNGQQRIPLPIGIGNCVFVNDITMEEIRAACYELAEAMKA